MFNDESVFIDILSLKIPVSLHSGIFFTLFFNKSMALILNIESSTKVCSVSLSIDNELLILKETDDSEYSHSKFLTVFIQQALSETDYKMKDIDAVAVSRGPGSYTGLRIGVSVAKGISYSVKKPLLAIDTLQSMALGVSENNTSKSFLFCPMIDARRMEVYTSFYDSSNKQIRGVSADIISEDSYADLLEENEIFFFGDGASKCKEIIAHKNAFFIENIHPSAKYMVSLSNQAYIEKRFEDTAYFEPFYLKDFIATVPKNKIS